MLFLFAQLVLFRMSDIYILILTGEVPVSEEHYGSIKQDLLREYFCMELSLQPLDMLMYFECLFLVS